MDKQYTQSYPNINQYHKSIYEMYFNTKKVGKWVNSSRTPEQMIEEILRHKPVPKSTVYAYIERHSKGETTRIWEYEAPSKKIYDNHTGETYKNSHIAEIKTGCFRATIVSQCNNPKFLTRRFRFE